jgi:hypothetical protein
LWPRIAIAETWRRLEVAVEVADTADPQNHLRTVAATQPPPSSPSPPWSTEKSSSDSWPPHGEVAALIWEGAHLEEKLHLLPPLEACQRPKENTSQRRDDASLPRGP